MKVFKLASLYLKHVFSASQEEEEEMLDWHRKTENRPAPTDLQNPVPAPVEGPFNLEVLKNIDAGTTDPKVALNRVYKYISSKLQRVSAGKGDGLGGTRVVYDLGDKVIKFAYRGWGLYQNRMESRLNSRSNLFAKVFDSHPRDYWLISEKIIPFKNEVDFETNTGLNTELLRKYCKMPEKLEPAEFDTVARMYRLSPEAKTLLIGVIDIRYKYGIACGDLCDPQHWGTTADGSLKIMDYGAEKEAVSRINSEETDESINFIQQLTRDENPERNPEPEPEPPITPEPPAPDLPTTVKPGTVWARKPNLQ